MAEASSIAAMLREIGNIKLQVSIETGQLEKLRKSLDISDMTKKMQRSIKSMTDDMGKGFEKVQKEIQKTTASAEEAPNLFSQIGDGFSQVQSIAENCGQAMEGVLDIRTMDFSKGISSAMDLVGGLATSFTGVGGAIQGVAGIISLIGEAIDAANRPMTELKERIEEMNQAYEEAKQAAQENFDSQMTDISILEIGVKNLDKMIRDNADGRKIDLAVESLIEQFPEIEDALDQVNGKWQIQKEKIDEIIVSMKQQALAELAYDDLKAALDQERLAKQEVDAIAAEKEALAEEDPEGFKDYLAAQSRIALADADVKEKYNAMEAIEDRTGQEYADAVYAFDMASREQSDALFAFSDARFDKFKNLDSRSSVAWDNWTTAHEASVQAEKDYQEEVYGDSTATQQDGSYTPEWSSALMDVLSPLKEQMETYNNAAVSINNGEINWGLRQAGADQDDIAQYGGSVEDAMQFVNDKIKEEAETYLTEAATLAETYLNQYGDELSETDRRQLENFVGTVKNGLDGSAKDMEQAVAWLRTWSLPVNATVTVKTAYDGSTSTTTRYGDGTTAIRNDKQEGNNALGTSFYPGGVTTINEQGDEMVELPTGSRIYPARESRRMYQRMNQGNYNINISDIVIREEADIDRIVTQIVNKLERARRNFA